MSACVACDRPVREDGICSICGTDNQAWRKLGWLDHVRRFPTFWPSLGLALVAVLFSVPCLFALPEDVACSFGLSFFFGGTLSIVATVGLYFVRMRLRKHEMLGRVKTGRHISLMALALISLAASVIISVLLVASLWWLITFFTTGSWEVGTLDVETNIPSSLASGSVRYMDPAWSSDGERVVFASDRDGNLEIYSRVIYSPTAELKRLTDNEAADRNPTWSKDGKTILFASNRGGRWSIYQMDTNGNNQRLFLAGPDGTANWMAPAWSPDSRYIAFVRGGPTPVPFLGMSWTRKAIAVRALPPAVVLILLGLTVAMMLLGAQRYAEQVNSDFGRPICLDTDRLRDVVLRSVRRNLGILVRPGAPPLPPPDRRPGEVFLHAPHPIDLDIHRLSTMLNSMVEGLVELLHISQPQSLRVRALEGGADGGLNLSLERQDRPRIYRVTTDNTGRVTDVEGPLEPDLNIISMKRTDDGGLEMTVGRPECTEEVDETSHEIIYTTKEERYDVVSDEFGNIRSFEKQPEEE